MHACAFGVGVALWGRVFPLRIVVADSDRLARRLGGGLTFALLVASVLAMDAVAYRVLE